MGDEDHVNSRAPSTAYSMANMANLFLATGASVFHRRIIYIYGNIKNVRRL